jgi:hypothetical protein
MVLRMFKLSLNVNVFGDDIIKGVKLLGSPGRGYV